MAFFKLVFEVPMGPHFFETVARRRSASLLSEFGFGHVREYAPFTLILSAFLSTLAD